MGKCALSCQTGLTECAGTCVDTGADEAHCDGCDKPCAAGELCIDGACALSCQAGLTQCAGTCVNTLSDLAHCGGCDQPCAAGELCAGGICALSCQTGLTNCAGTCVDTRTDNANCGGCGAVCAAGEVCSDFTCSLSCQTGLTNCAGMCVNTQTDLASCGACGTQCPPGEVCSAGACALSCQSGLTDCNGTCVDLKTDDAHCGACDKSCTAHQRCIDGYCHAELAKNLAPTQVWGYRTWGLHPGQKLALDDADYIYAILEDGYKPHLVVSADGGHSYAERPQCSPYFGSMDDVVVHAQGRGTVHLAAVDEFAMLYCRSDDTGVTWSSVTRVSVPGVESIDGGASLAIQGDDVYIAVETPTGFKVFSNHAGGAGAFTSVDIPGELSFFEVLADPVNNKVWLAIGSPGIKIFRSADGGLTFTESQVNTSGAATAVPFSDWTVTQGRLFGVGDNASLQQYHLTSYDAVAGDSETNPIQPLSKPENHVAIASDKAGAVYAVTTPYEPNLFYVRPWLYYRRPQELVFFASPLHLADDGYWPTVAALEGRNAAVIAFTKENEARIMVEPL